MGVRMKLTGLPNFLRGLDREAKRLEKGYQRGVIAAGNVLRENIKAHTPVDTGALEASTVSWRFGSGFNIVILVGQGAEVEGFYDEYGREKVPYEYAVYRHEGNYDDRLWFDYVIDANIQNIESLIEREMSK